MDSTFSSPMKTEVRSKEEEDAEIEAFENESIKARERAQAEKKRFDR